MVEKKKIIDKKFIPTIIAIVILIILAVVMLPEINKPEKQPEDNKENILFDFKDSNISFIGIYTSDNPEINVDLALQKDGTWTVNDKLAYTPEVMRILSVLKNVRVLSKIDDYGSLKEFGLNPPDKILYIKFKDNKTKPIKLFVGDYAPASRDRYIKFEKDTEILLANNYVYSAISVTPSGLQNKDIVGIEPENAVKITIKNNDGTFVLGKEINGWHVTLPNNIKVYADQNYVSTIFNNFFGNSAQAVVKEEYVNLNDLNLKNPIIEMTVEGKDGKTSDIIVSEKIQGAKLHYVYNKSVNKAYIVNYDRISRINFNDLEIRNKELIDVRFPDVAKVIIIDDGKEFEIKKNRRQLWECKQLKLEEIVISQFVEDLTTYFVDIATSLDIEKSGEDFGFDKPLMEIIVYDINKMQDKGYKPYSLKVGKKSKEGKYFIQKSNDPYLYLINENTYQILKRKGEKPAE